MKSFGQAWADGDLIVNESDEPWNRSQRFNLIPCFQLRADMCWLSGSPQLNFIIARHEKKYWAFIALPLAAHFNFTFSFNLQLKFVR